MGVYLQQSKRNNNLYQIIMKDNHFKLSNSFTSLFAQKGTTNSKQASPLSQSLDKGLFKLNPKSANTLEDVPVEMLKRKSKNKLQSLKDESNDKKWSIFQQKLQIKDVNKQKKTIPKKYHLDISNGQKTKLKEDTQNKEVEFPYDIVRPSKLNERLTQASQQQELATPTLFQTPLLPCFASQFRHNMNGESIQFKSLEQKKGVWKIGKIKIKGNKAKLTIGGIQFEANQADVSGRACVVGEDNLYQLPNWNKIWVVQPSQDLFR